MNKPMRRGVALTYSEILRILGQYVDRSKLGEVRLVETEEYFILQGLVMEGSKAGERITFEITSEDIRDMSEDALSQRLKEITG
jgi:hypothetical protein